MLLFGPSRRELRSFPLTSNDSFSFIRESLVNKFSEGNNWQFCIVRGLHLLKGIYLRIKERREKTDFTQFMEGEENT